MSVWNRLFVEDVNPFVALAPANFQGAAKQSAYRSMAGYQGCAIIYIKGAGTTGDNPSLVITQGQDIAGTNAKALNFSRYDQRQATDITGVGVLTEVDLASPTNEITDTSAALEEMYVVDIKAEMLDTNNGFRTIAAEVSNIGTSTHTESSVVLFCFYGAKFSKDELDDPTTIP